MINPILFVNKKPMKVYTCPLQWGAYLLGKIMELKSLIVAYIASLIGQIGLFGWSHKSTRDDIKELEKDVLRRPTESEVRRIIQDKIDVIETNMLNIKEDIRDLKTSQNDMSRTLLSILDVLTVIKNKNGK